MFCKASSVKARSSSVLYLSPGTWDLGDLPQPRSFKCHPCCNSQMRISRTDLSPNCTLLFLMVCLTSPQAHFILQRLKTELLIFPLKPFHLQPSPSQLMTTPKLAIVQGRKSEAFLTSFSHIKISFDVSISDHFWSESIHHPSHLSLPLSLSLLPPAYSVIS